MEISANIGDIGTVLTTSHFLNSSFTTSTASTPVIETVNATTAVCAPSTSLAENTNDLVFTETSVVSVTQTSCMAPSDIYVYTTESCHLPASTSPSCSSSGPSSSSSSPMTPSHTASSSSNGIPSAVVISSTVLTQGSQVITGPTTMTPDQGVTGTPRPAGSSISTPCTTSVSPAITQSSTWNFPSWFPSGFTPPPGFTPPWLSRCPSCTPMTVLQTTTLMTTVAPSTTPQSSTSCTSLTEVPPYEKMLVRHRPQDYEDITLHSQEERELADRDAQFVNFQDIRPSHCNFFCQRKKLMASRLSAESAQSTSLTGHVGLQTAASNPVSGSASTSLNVANQKHNLSLHVNHPRPPKSWTRRPSLPRTADSSAHEAPSTTPAYSPSNYPRPSASTTQPISAHVRRGEAAAENAELAPDQALTFPPNAGCVHPLCGLVEYCKKNPAYCDEQLLGKNGTSTSSVSSTQKVEISKPSETSSGSSSTSSEPEISRTRKTSAYSASTTQKLESPLPSEVSSDSSITSHDLDVSSTMHVKRNQTQLVPKYPDRVRTTCKTLTGMEKRGEPTARVPTSDERMVTVTASEPIKTTEVTTQSETLTVSQLEFSTSTV